METLLQSNGLRMIYAELTRQALGMSVMRAIVPATETLADFDRYSQVHPRLYAKYLS